MALLLEVAQIERVVKDLIVGGRAILTVAALELQQEYDVVKQHDIVDALTHARDAVLKEQLSAVEGTELVL